MRVSLAPCLRGQSPLSHKVSPSAWRHVIRLHNILHIRISRNISTFPSGGMSRRELAPYAPQDQKQVRDTLRTLDENSKKNGKGKGGFFVRKRTFEISDRSGRTVDSWALNEWDYKKGNLPTYARGLFTTDNNGNPEIAVRGYDKFFNVGEVRKTEWANVEEHTRGPYELSVKENGCIIFIAGYDDQTLLVTSKHSTGHRGDASANHSLAGETWVAKQLKAIGKTGADLAKKLRSMNATAVAELCDDEFEEHVLRYDPDDAGLYLHGINLNLPEFATYPGNLVDKFAEEWGFRKTMYVMKDTIAEVKTFLKEVAETGNYQGRDTEGFVIRCQAREDKDSPWHDWFFKYKFEEPYLMYRQWREVTKAVISGKAPKYKKHKQITQEYLHYAKRQLSRDPQLGKQFNQNHGIIAMRDGFLKEKGMKGSDIIREEGVTEDVSKDIVLVPVATIGCGKTTVATALVYLFKWAHQQNDNVQGRGNRAQRFVSAITMSMAAHPVVIADRNNHQKRERDQIIKDISAVVPEATFVALHYIHDRGNYEEIRQAMRERVFARGDKHQTIQAASQGRQEVEGIMEGFLNRFQPIDINSTPDNAFDLVIDLDVTATSRENLETVVNKMHEEYPNLFEMPTSDRMDEAINYAMNDYHPGEKHNLAFLSKKENTKGRNKDKPSPALQQANGSTSISAPAKPLKAEYFCISLPTERIQGILNAVFNAQSAETARFYNQLKSIRRVHTAFHVTLIHRASASEYPDYWEKLNDSWQQKLKADQEAGKAPKGNLGGTNAGVNMGMTRVHLEQLVWDDRVMTILCRLPDVEENGFKTVNVMAHATVGTADGSIKPKESNDLLQRWNEGEDNKIQDIKVKGQIILDGIVRGIASR